jgi:hypothetical protein
VLANDDNIGWGKMGRLAVFAAFLSALPFQCSAQAITATAFYKVVEHGRRVEMDHLFSIDPTCRSLGITSVSLLSAPRGSSVETSVERRMPMFIPKSNVRARCSTFRLPSTVVYYRARPDFVGPDAFVTESVFPDGYAQTRRYQVNVR